MFFPKQQYSQSQNQQSTKFYPLAKNIIIATKTGIYERWLRTHLHMALSLADKQVHGGKAFATEMDFLRRTARKSKWAKVLNEEMKRITKKEITILEEIQ